MCLGVIDGNEVIELLTKVVARALPFQFTTDPDMKPVPFTVSVNPAPPGATASGTSGWLISGTGFTVLAGVYSQKSLTKEELV